MFQKGNRANPHGRAGDPLIAKIRAKALEVCPEAIQTLINIMRSGENKYSLMAANSLLDRGIGKPIQAADSEAGQIKVIVVNRDGVLDVVRDDSAQS